MFRNKKKGPRSGNNGSKSAGFVVGSDSIATFTQSIFQRDNIVASCVKEAVSHKNGYRRHVAGEPRDAWTIAKEKEAILLGGSSYRNRNKLHSLIPSLVRNTFLPYQKKRWSGIWINSPSIWQINLTVVNCTFEWGLNRAFSRDPLHVCCLEKTWKEWPNHWGHDLPSSPFPVENLSFSFQN